MNNRLEATRYIKKIRNKDKHAYAEDYWNYLSGMSTHEPEPPEKVDQAAVEAVRTELQHLHQA